MVTGILCFVIGVFVGAIGLAIASIVWTKREDDE